VKIEIAAELPFPPGNVAVSVDGRMFASLHGLFEPRYKVVEVRKDGKVVPYPNDAWNSDPTKDENTLAGVLGLRADANGVLWMLDNVGRKVVAWDTRREKLHRIIRFPEVIVPQGAFLNDLAVDLEHQSIYIIDTGNVLTGRLGALIVVDLTTGQSRRLLHDSPMLIGEAKRPLAVMGKPLAIATGVKERPILTPIIGGDPIAMDRDNRWLYFGAMCSDIMYKIPTEDLRNGSLDADTLSQRVQRHGDKRFTDGISTDTAGNIYTTSIEDNAIGIISPDGTYQQWVQDDHLAWPDGMSFGPDGMLYVTLSQIHRSGRLNAGKSEPVAPYTIIRVQPLAAGIPGR
jgi:sugar lactone lactonase YvrE